MKADNTTYARVRVSYKALTLYICPVSDCPWETKPSQKPFGWLALKCVGACSRKKVVRSWVNCTSIYTLYRLTSRPTRNTLANKMITQLST